MLRDQEPPFVMLESETRESVAEENIFAPLWNRAKVAGSETQHATNCPSFHPITSSLISQCYELTYPEDSSAKLWWTAVSYWVLWELLVAAEKLIADRAEIIPIWA